MKHWFRDTHFRSLMKNVSYLAASRAVAAACGIATLAFAARGLGVAMFGMLVLVHSYTQAASGLTKFQSWQLIIRYGSPALVTGEPRALAAPEPEAAETVVAPAQPAAQPTRPGDPDG